MVYHVKNVNVPGLRQQAAIDGLRLNSSKTYIVQLD
jgi:hypothetical protein